MAAMPECLDAHKLEGRRVSCLQEMRTWPLSIVYDVLVVHFCIGGLLPGCVIK